MHKCVFSCVHVGITSLLIRGKPVRLTEALKWAESELMGCHAHHWPLTKLLDIGGVARSPSLTGMVSSRGCSPILTLIGVN